MKSRLVTVLRVQPPRVVLRPLQRARQSEFYQNALPAGTCNSCAALLLVFEDLGRHISPHNDQVSAPVCIDAAADFDRFAGSAFGLWLGCCASAPGVPAAAGGCTRFGRRKD